MTLRADQEHHMTQYTSVLLQMPSLYEGPHGVSLQLPPEFLQCNNTVQTLKIKLGIEIQKYWEGLRKTFWFFFFD